MFVRVPIPQYCIRQIGLLTIRFSAKRPREPQGAPHLRPPMTTSGRANVRPLMVFAIDLEGVLAPEIWPRLGEHFDIPELHLTTRDLGDFDALMRQRVAATRARGLHLRELEEVAHSMEPYLGARDFLGRLRMRGQV